MSENDQEKELPTTSEVTEPEEEERAEPTESLTNEPFGKEEQPSQQHESPNESPEPSSEEPVGDDDSQNEEGATEIADSAGEVTDAETAPSLVSPEEGTTQELLPGPSEHADEDPILETPGPEEEAPPPLRHEEVRGSVEAVLYAASEPLSPRDLRKILPEVGTEEIKQCLQEILELYQGEGRGLQIVEVAGGHQITTRPEFHERVSTLFHYKPPSKLSIQALETLATIAYRQPITVPEIQELRGVRSTSVIKTLLEKRLVRITGRKAVVGRPLLYGTTKEFLLRFGLKDLGELPRLEDMAEVFGEDLALQLEDLGGAGSPSTNEVGDEYPSGIVSADPPMDASIDDAVPSEAEGESGEKPPVDDDSDFSNGGSRGQDS